jgi:hypothetical protein
MFARERSLVARYGNEPFVLLGVNADESREKLRQVQHKAGLSWQSWWDGPGGPISRAWEVDRFPSFFLLDRQGAVRFQHAGVPPAGLLEEKIEQLLREGT